MLIIWFINSALGWVIGLLLYPFARIPPFWGLAFISALTGILLILIFKYVSSQEGIRRTKNKVRGYFLEVWIYKHQFRTVIGSVGRILVSNLNYMKYAVAPLLVMFIPVILIMSHLNLYYGNRPLKIGETAILSVKWKNPAFLTANPLSLQSSEGIAIEAGPLSIPAHSETNWRIKALSGGTNIILIRSQNVELERKVEVSADRMRKISTKRGSFTSFADAIFYGAEKPIPAKVPIEGIYLNYPSNRIETLGIKFHWIVLFFILSLISGFALKGVFKVEI